jgi:hypothetical protein
VEQLLGLARSSSKANKARRLTVRPKFRAIQALRFFPSGSSAVSGSSISHATGSFVWTRQEEELWSFLYCLSEVHELRLPCSEEVLAASIGYEIREGSDQDTGVQTISRSARDQVAPAGASESRLLVKTLLRDEGHQSAVSELCRYSETHLSIRTMIIRLSGIFC